MSTNARTTDHLWREKKLQNESITKKAHLFIFFQNRTDGCLTNTEILQWTNKQKGPWKGKTMPVFHRSVVSSREDVMTLKDNQENELVPRSNRKPYRSEPQRREEETFGNAHLLVPGKEINFHVMWGGFWVLSDSQWIQPLKSGSVSFANTSHPSFSVHRKGQVDLYALSVCLSPSLPKGHSPHLHPPASFLTNSQTSILGLIRQTKTGTDKTKK